MKRTIAILFALIAGFGLPAGAQSAAPAFELPAVSGETYSLSQYDGKIVVLEWTNYDCPFVRKFYGTGTMQAMQKKYTDKGVIWLSICSSAPGKQGNFTVEVWKKRIQDAGASPTAVLLDDHGTVGRAYGASNTPHIFVVDASGHLAYQGSVDDNRSADPETIKGARNYLEEALDALLAGKPVPVAQTKPYGCSVKY